MSDMVLLSTSGCIDSFSNCSTMTKMLTRRFTRWEKIAVQMNYRSFSGKDPISVITFLTKLKRAFLRPGIHKDAILSHFSNYMTSPALASIKSYLTLSSNSVISHRETTTLNAEVFDHLVSKDVTDLVRVIGDDDIPDFKQRCLTP